MSAGPANVPSPLFKVDHCANCQQLLQQQIVGLFCSELCQQTAKDIRYWRRVVRDERGEDPEVQLALRTRLAFLLAGGYPAQARRLPAATRKRVWDRAQGRCQKCGRPGKEIDHVDGDSPELPNLHLLCELCHHRKTEERMVAATPHDQEFINRLYHERVAPDQPLLLCDDQDQWAKIWRRLRRERLDRPL